MLEFSQIDDSAYDEAQTKIAYCKLFPLMLEDFVTRLDSAAMLSPSNLPFVSTVTVNPGQAVQVAVPAGTGSSVSPGTGAGTGQVTPVFNGKNPHPSTNALKAQKEAIEKAGGAATDAVLNNALGG